MKFSLRRYMEDVTLHFYTTLIRFLALSSYGRVLLPPCAGKLETYVAFAA